MSSRSYLSIGDVLTLLRQEFPDVTISKIRFLESQGLVNPERTPSGYRKFYEHDVERLRWVLRQQREHFLPLKVIKDRLDEDSNGSPAAAPAAKAAPAAGRVSGRPADRGRGRGRGGGRRRRCWSPTGADRAEADRATEAASGLPGIETAARHRTPARAAVGGTTALGRRRLGADRPGRARPPGQPRHPGQPVGGPSRRCHRRPTGRPTERRPTDRWARPRRRTGRPPRSRRRARHVGPRPHRPRRRSHPAAKSGPGRGVRAAGGDAPLVADASAAARCRSRTSARPAGCRPRGSPNSRSTG